MANPQQIAQLCPLLTIATFISKPKEESRVVQLGVAAAKPGQSTGEPEAIGCQGPNCAWFVPIRDESGRPIGGNCAMALMPTALGMVNQSMRQAAGLDPTMQRPAGNGVEKGSES